MSREFCEARHVQSASAFMKTLPLVERILSNSFEVVRHILDWGQGKPCQTSQNHAYNLPAGVRKAFFIVSYPFQAK